jgi:Protein of unknown function (DUF4231)
MEIQNYIKERVDDQITWYDDKSQTNRFYFQLFKVIEISFASILVLLSGFLKDNTIFPYIAGIIGTSIAIIVGLQSIFKFHEKWSQYRSTSETLKNEKYTFLNLTGTYTNTEEPNKLFVERIEFLISKENSNWQQFITQNDNKSEK